MLDIRFTDEKLLEEQAVVIFMDNKLKLDSQLMALDQQYHGLISKTIQNKLNFAGKFGQVQLVTFVTKSGEMKYLMIVGLGDEAALTKSKIEELGGIILTHATSAKLAVIGFIMSYIKINNYRVCTVAALVASGALLASYRFNKYRTNLTEAEKFAVESLVISVDDVEESKKLFTEKRLIAEAVFFVRDICNEPSNIKTPEAYSNAVINRLEDIGVEVNIIGEREMQNLGMGALLGVGQGSQNESKLVIMIYRGKEDSDVFPVAFVGKGVIFDSGGISLKPAHNMELMKYDMAGSAAVVGAVMALASRRAKVNVVGVIGLVENMPSGNAQRPGDVVTTMSGKTVEILNTDAEGRLVLADAIWYTQEKFQPECVIDLATLTGAIVVSLGATYAGCFTSDDSLADKLIEAGLEVNEKLWRMPLHSDYDEMIKSDIADLANIGNIPGAAGSCTAAHFVKHFIKDGVAWAHLDIAGVANSKKASSLGPKGATSYGVRLLERFVHLNYE